MNFPRPTPAVTRSLLIAGKEAADKGHDYIMASDLLIGLISVPSSVSALLAERGVTLEAVRAVVEDFPPRQNLLR